MSQRTESLGDEDVRRVARSQRKLATVTFAEGALLHELVEAQTARTPDAVAVIHRGSRLSYAALNSRANRLARHLRDLGVGPEIPVGLYADRSVELIVGLLGILKAGGLYVPLDPTYPRGRVAMILDDAAPRIVLTRRDLRRALPELAARVILLDDPVGEVDSHDDGNLGVPVSSRSLAYVIYTSGSTGRPKGVAADHRSMVNRIAAQASFDAFGGDDVCCQKTAIGFVDAIFEILGALSFGRPLVLAPMSASRDVAGLASFIGRSGITRLITVPSLAESLLDTPAAGDTLASLRSWTLSGEKLSASLVHRLQATLPSCKFINLYGSSEIAADATYHICTRSDGENIPIGRPIPNSYVYILDDHGEPTPVGTPGEMYIGGVGVARGYLNRPLLTAERFVADPFRIESGERLFKTGDRARWLPDGAIEYLGRNDLQVKIRGVRVELGEIETALLRHPDVKEAVVVLNEGAAPEPHLIAYVTARALLSVEELRRHVRQALPEHMVPRAVVVLERLPQTPSGKVDRRGLPAAGPSAYATRPFEAPVTEAERVLAALWQDLLDIPRVSRTENFFELGGHSLLVVRMIARLRALGFTTKAHEVFASETLEGLAQTLIPLQSTRFEVPGSRIPRDCRQVLPRMLPLIALSAKEIERIAERVPGGHENIQDIYPLTPLQKGLLFHHLLDDATKATYVVSTLLCLSSHRRLDDLMAAMQGAIDRHDVLRTAILWQELPQPVQVVCRSARLIVEVLHLDPSKPAIEQMKEQMRAARDAVNLQRAPLLKLTVVHGTAQGSCHALLQIHHLIMDDVSLKALVAEIVGQLAGGQLPLTAPAQFRDYIAHVLAHSETEYAETFFRKKLGNIEECTAPYELLDVRGSGADVEEAALDCPAELAWRVSSIARQLGVTAATLFHAAWALVVSLTTGRDDVVLGTVLLGQFDQDSDLESGLGNFINTLPLRLSLRGASVLELVKQTQRELAQLLSVEHAPLVLAQRCSAMDASQPLFTAVLNYRHESRYDHREWEDAEGFRVLAHEERTNYPITLSVDEVGDGFRLSAQTRRPVDPARVVEHLHTALESLVLALENRPQALALSLAALSQKDLAQLAAFNDTACAFPNDRAIHELFEEQVKRTPDAIAVVDGSECWTYAELNLRSNQLARHLESRGVGAEGRVAICLERSGTMVVALLGVLKAGAAYVPLDPSYPKERRDYVLSDARPCVVLTQESLRGEFQRMEVVALDTQWGAISAWPGDDARSHVRLNRSTALAYVIYTSGSTGRPKGVAIEHRSAVNLIAWAASEFGAQVFSRTLFSTSLNFDLSVYECFVPLAVGGSLTIVKDALALLSSPIDVTLINTVPSAIKAVLDGRGVPRSTRVVNLAGEALGQDAVDRLFAQSDVDAVCNLYGPSETTTYSTWISMPRASGFTPTIGRPIANTTVYILDTNRRIVPIGVVGELYIGGVGVARGYLNRPELTAERFIQDPFSATPGARMYRTGDLGRWRADGTIDYLGRNDHQVKIRGFRIELGEIEVRLKAHAQIKEAAVVAREDVPGEKRLVAYIVPAEGVPLDRAPSAEELKAHLAVALPEHMIPSAIVRLERFPLTPNGKLDRRALPLPQADAFARSSYEAPSTDAERALASIWQQVLRVEGLGRHDGFFKVGGDSLLAMQMAVRIRSEFSIELPMSALYEFPTLAQLAAQLDELRQQQLLALIGNGGDDIDELLERVASMSDSGVQTLMRERRMGAGHE